MISTRFGGFQIRFENGYTISIFNGFGSYSENHFNTKLHEKMENLNFTDSCISKDCEVAVIYEDIFCTDKFIETDDSVKGYISADELADLIIKVKNAEKI